MRRSLQGKLKKKDYSNATFVCRVEKELQENWVNLEVKEKRYVRLNSLLSVLSVFISIILACDF